MQGQDRSQYSYAPVTLKSKTMTLKAKAASLQSSPSKESAFLIKEAEFQASLFPAIEFPKAYRKAVQVVHSIPLNNMTLVLRKMLNAWIKNAIDTEVDKDGYWSINIAEMASDLGFDSNNHQHLREAAMELMKIVFEFDVLATQHPTPKLRKLTDWDAATLFPNVKQRSGKLLYQINHELQERVLQPKMYAMIDLNVIGRFKRSSSIAIYEHCVRFVNIGATTPVHWTVLRSIILGRAEVPKTYEEFKHFNNKILRPSVVEMNSLADITVEMKLTKEGRQVTTVQFIVSRKNDVARQDMEPSNEEAMKAIGELVLFGLSQSEAKKMLRAYPAQRVLAALAYTKDRIANKKASVIENPAAYLRNAVARGYGASEEMALAGEMHDAQIKGEPSTPARSGGAGEKSSSQNKLVDAFMMKQSKEAQAYFNERGPADQDALVERYNAQQEIGGFRIKKGKPFKGAQSAFLRWLAQDTWGQPSTENLLEFAQTMF